MPKKGRGKRNRNQKKKDGIIRAITGCRNIAGARSKDLPYIYEYVCTRCKEKRFGQTPNTRVCSKCKKGGGPP